MSKVKAIIILVLAVVSAALVLSVQADDGRINPANYHFGGDVLYCQADNGCRVLNEHGDLLITWSQDSINAAVQQSIDSNQSVLVSEQQATYGLMGLWVQYVEINDNNEAWHLCLQGYDEWGKSNDMCFKASSDGYQPIGVAAPAAPEVNHTCDKFKVGEDVMLIANNSVHGLIDSIDYAHGTLVFDAEPAKCSEVEPGKS